MALNVLIVDDSSLTRKAIKRIISMIDLETDGGITGRTYLFAFTPSMLKPTVL